jgi:hypothetical protein
LSFFGSFFASLLGSFDVESCCCAFLAAMISARNPATTPKSKNTSKSQGLVPNFESNHQPKAAPIATETPISNPTEANSSARKNGPALPRSSPFKRRRS